MQVRKLREPTDEAESSIHDTHIHSFMPNLNRKVRVNRYRNDKGLGHLDKQPNPSNLQYNTVSEVRSSKKQSSSIFGQTMRVRDVP